jgi:hypothetical protein
VTFLFLIHKNDQHALFFYLFLFSSLFKQMLPQFGYIVAQAGAEYYSTLTNATPPPPAPSAPPPPPPTPTPPVQSNGHNSALAPLLNNKPFGFTNGLSSSHSNYSNVPFYSRQPSPPPQAMQPILPPPSFLYNNNKPKEMIPPPPPPSSKSNIMEKNEPWYHHPMKSPPPVQQQKREPSPYYSTAVEEDHQGRK